MNVETPLDCGVHRVQCTLSVTYQIFTVIPPCNVRQLINNMQEGPMDFVFCRLYPCIPSHRFSPACLLSTLN